MPGLLALLLLPPVAACDGGAPWSGSTESARGAERADLGPTAAYDRRLIFLGPGAALPTVAIFDFAAVSDSAGLRRGARARLVDGHEWLPLLDAGWEHEPMRDPWRLVPHEALKLVVGDAGEIDALVVRGDDDVRLEPGSAIAEYSPDAATQFVLRQAHLTFGAEAVSGVLLDAQLGRAVDAAPRAAPPPPSPADDTGTEATEETAEPAGTGMDPTPAPRAGAEALLVDNAGYYAVFSRAAAGPVAWIRSGNRDDVRRGARLEAAAWEVFEDAGVQVAVGWRIVAREDLAGELTAESADRAALGGDAGSTALGYVIVSGWIEDRGARRNVYGVVRSVR